MTKDDLRLLRSTTKALERCQIKLMRNFLFSREDSRIIEYRNKYNLLEFV